jgi:hypothetical protein
LFGDASGELCNTMESRMRTHAPNVAAAANDAAQPSVPATPLFMPPSVVPAAPLVFDYTSPFKNAA